MKSKRAASIGLIAGIALSAAVYPIAKILFEYHGPPHVTVINVTGRDIVTATVSLNAAKTVIGTLKDNQSVTVPVRGSYGESSTRIAWTDIKGTHEGSAQDYMENGGFYHSTIILMPDYSVRAIYNIKESNQAL